MAYRRSANPPPPRATAAAAVVPPVALWLLLVGLLGELWLPPGFVGLELLLPDDGPVGGAPQSTQKTFCLALPFSVSKVQNSL
jgi:hypothetical protein